MKRRSGWGAALFSLLAAGLIGSGSAQAEAEKAKQVTVGREKIDLASVQFDRTCEHPMAAFSLSENTEEMFHVGVDTALKNAGARLGNFLGVASPKAGDVQQQLIAAAVQKAKKLNWLPASVERLYGQAQFKAYLAGRTLLEREDDDRGLYQIADKMLADSVAAAQEFSPDASIPYEFEIHIEESDGDNAVAFPGGIILIDESLLANPERQGVGQFALAHEISHVLQRHQTQALQSRLVDTAAVSTSLPKFLKTMRDMQRGAQEVMGLVYGGKLIFERNRIDQELQSDACSARLTQRVLSDNNKLAGAVKGFLATLPPPTSEDSAEYHKLRRPDLDAVVEVVGRPLDRHPSTGERQQFLGEVLREIVVVPPPAQPDTTKATAKSKTKAKPKL